MTNRAFSTFPRTCRVLFLLGALCLLVPSALAQIEVKFGAKEGGNFATFGGADGLEASALNQTGAIRNRRPGLIIGGLAVLDPSGPVGVQSEVLWIWKGSKVRAGDTEATTKINYLEVPLLAKFETPLAWGPVTTHLLAGPTVALTTQAQRNMRTTDAQGQMRFVRQRSLDEATRNVELGVALGGAVGFAFSESATITLEVRYRRGLSRAFGQPIGSQSSVPDAWNQGLAATLGFIYSSGWTFSLN